ncbi:MAG: DEAD/DEAH box helicase [Campylobacterota bacterium]|nr:DEAD/DEAH box helicase [Campylobacterota bacterium]
MSEEKTKKYYDHISVGKRTKQLSYFVQQHDKNRMFTEIVKTINEKQTIVLVKNKTSADKLMTYLNEKDIKSLAIHGNHRASQIEDAQTAFNSKEIKILITTDRILEKLSLTDIEILVNYDLPFDSSDYFKRLRLVDETGESIALIDPEDEKSLETIEFMMRCEMTESEIENFEHTNRLTTSKKDKTKKPRHKKVQQQAKRKKDVS